MNQPTKQPTLPPELIDSKLVVLATVRDCATTLQSDISKLQTALGLFKNVHWFIVESDSTDNTLQVLKELKDSVPNFEFISLDKLEPELKLRTERIAHCRNRYLDEIETNSNLSDAKFCVIADLDGSQNLLTHEGLMSCFERDDWGACFSNQDGLYYDIWALRHPMWSPNDCWQAAFFLQNKKVDRDKARFGAVFSRMIDIDPTSDWIEVESAFGGLGVYKKKYLSGARYIGKSEFGAWGGQFCEHVSFHETIRLNGAKLFINPQLINTALNEHSGQVIVPEDIGHPLGIEDGSASADDAPENINVIEDAPPKLGQIDVSHTTREDIIGAYKIFLNRSPESMHVVYSRLGMKTDMVLIDFLTSEEFLKRKGVDKLILSMHAKLNSILKNNEGTK